MENHMAEITYFEKGGPKNTKETLTIARKRFDQGDIDTVLVASSYGDTALVAIGRFKDSGAKLIVIGEVIKGEQSPPEEVVKQLSESGIQVIWGITMGAMSTYTKDQTASRIADAYRRVSEGFKVVCEITLIATTQGYIGAGEKVLAVAGTHRGADTAVVASAAPFGKFKDFEVNEILCKPYRRSE
jgi:hypothetical protein